MKTILYAQSPAKKQRLCSANSTPTKKSIGGRTIGNSHKEKMMTRPKAGPRLMNRHHRLPRSRGGANSLANISIVDQKLHRAWHMLVGNMTAPEAAKMFSDTWIDAEYYLVAVPRKRIQAKKRRKRRYCTDCSSEVLKFIEQTKKGEVP